MKRPVFDDAKAGRSQKIIGAFRGMLSVRALWGAGSVVALGLLAGLLFYRSDARVPLQGQAEPDQVTALQSEEIAINDLTEQAPAHPAPTDAASDQSNNSGNSGSPSAVLPSSTDKTADTNCNTSAKQQAATVRDARLKAERKRYHSSGALSSLTFGLISIPTAKDEEKHRANLAQIEADYRQALAAAGCV